MLPQVKTLPLRFEEYKEFIRPELFREIKKLSHELKGLRVVHLNATPFGGGVAEILKSLVPLLGDLGVKAEWYVIPPNDHFFNITKKFHNTLQGKKGYLAAKDKKIYLNYNKSIARMLKGIRADVWVFHDPQVVPLKSYLKKRGQFIWRCHIDLTSPNQEFWQFLSPFIEDYDELIFTMPEYVSSKLPQKKINIIAPAIDPLTPKNSFLSLPVAKAVLEKFRINIQKPLVSQVARFDPWKDPLGVIKAYRRAKRKIKNLQLALVGVIVAQDDPEAISIFQAIEREAKDLDIFLFWDPHQIGEVEVNAFLSGSEVIIQKSIREGFGLTVTEAMWKAKAVIGGNCGGIKKQIRDGQNGFLVSSYQECAEKLIELLQDPYLRNKIGERARESVRENYLIPRLARDYLRLFRKLTS